MVAFIAFLVVLNLIGALLLMLGHWRLRRQLRQQMLRADALARHLGAEGSPATLPPSFADRTVISVEVLNPMEVGKRESIAARLFGAVTPNIVRHEVNRQLCDRLRENLMESGVVADVQLHNGR